MKKIILFVCMAMMFASCAVEQQYGKLKESHLSGCNTGNAESPARVAGVATDDDPELEYRHYVRVKHLTGDEYYFVAQYQVNCCPQSIDAHLYILDDDELIVNFEERLGMEVCDCMCPLRCEATITEMPRGQHPVKIYYNGQLSHQTTITFASGVDDVVMLDTLYL